MISHHPVPVIVWWGVNYSGVTEIHFSEKGIKAKAKIYVKADIELIMKTLILQLFNGRKLDFSIGLLLMNQRKPSHHVGAECAKLHIAL